ncbi:protamine-like [Cataglyphis hispanica]|uniref:protamine-like n=1 Tax=Cataglyphis hispanica TaxID=1086592 RepID=UPI0021800CC5|nr:protamine-like [Cataglyphis hispanica]
MGNTSSTQPSKTQKDKKESHGCIIVSDRSLLNTQKRTLQFRLSRSAGTRKDRRPANRNGKTVGQSSRDWHNVRATNPFIIFFLRLRSKKPKEHVTVIARAAGKLWARMSPEQRKKYVDLANAEKKRRQERKRKRKCLSTRSR